MQVLFQGKAELIKEIALRLTDAEIKVASGPLPGGGWEQRAWLAVASEHKERALQIQHDYEERMIAREGLPVRDAVADFDAEEAECPACLTKFKTAGATKCPDCGLHFR